MSETSPTPILSQGRDIADAAALVCTHCAADNLPVRLARRDEPVHDVDTGWQFHCDVHDHAGDADAVVCSIREVVEFDPSIRPLLDNPPKTTFRRESIDTPWAAEPYEQE